MAASASAHAWQTPAPPLAGHLVDEARMLTPAAADALKSTLAMLLLVLLSGDSSKSERKGSGNTGGEWKHVRRRRRIARLVRHAGVV